MALTDLSFQQNLEVLVPDISAPLDSSRFAFVAPAQSTNIKFLGPTTILQRIATATASQGRIQPFEALSPNASYSVSFFAPAVSCEEANETTTLQMLSVYNDTVGQFFTNYSVYLPPGSLQYWAFSPSGLQIFWEIAKLRDSGVKMTNDIELSGRLEPFDTKSDPSLMVSNQMWILYAVPSVSPQYNYSDVSEGNESHPNPLFDGLICKMYNTSYAADITFRNGIPTIDLAELIHYNYIYFPSSIGIPNMTDPYFSVIDNNGWLNVTDVKNLDRFPWFDQAFISYSAFMYTINDLLHGILSARNSSGPQDTYSNELESSIFKTSLAGSVNLRDFFKFSYMDYEDYPGRVPDFSLARNRTLLELIEKLSINITLSLMSEEILW